MKTTLALVGWLVLGLNAAASGQALDPAVVELASSETLLVMPEPPIGYAASKHALMVGERLAGFRVLVTKEGVVSKVLINIETRDLSVREARVAAYKGYVNGFAKGLEEQGFKATKRELPDFEKSDFKTPLEVDATFANAEGTTIHVKKRIFFTTKGYDLTVIAENERDLKLLADWSAQIQPAPAKAKP